MKRTKPFILYLLVVTAFIFPCCMEKKEENVMLPVRGQLLFRTDTLIRKTAQLYEISIAFGKSLEKIKPVFLDTRIAYKELEWAAEYFTPVLARRLNGPPVPELEESGISLTPPAGLQVIEGLIYSGNENNRIVLIRQIEMLQRDLAVLRSKLTSVEMQDWQVLEAIKQEIFRVETLGITGFDCPQSLNSLSESASALDGIRFALLGLQKTGTDSAVKIIGNGISFLQSQGEFKNFDRMEFILHFANPASTAIAGMAAGLSFKGWHYNLLLNQSARTLYDTNTFNVNAYAPDRSSFLSPEKVALGKKLFADPVLSGTGNRSCRSCHQPEKAFTDGLTKNSILGKSSLLDRNTPTLINAALQPALFYDLRVGSLEDQAHSVVHSSKEMGGSMKKTVDKLRGDSTYTALFRKAFPREDPNRLDTFEIMNALGSYIRSLTMLNSRWDEYMRGHKEALNKHEVHGFNLFMGKAKCATCHYPPLFNGNFPTSYSQMENEVIGVPKDRSNTEPDPDPGRFDVAPFDIYLHAFKTPTIRNAALTAPYMHNGVFSTLEQVVDFYNQGGGRGEGLSLDNQTLPEEKLNLTETEKDDIIQFIKSLNSKRTEP